MSVFDCFHLPWELGFQLLGAACDEQITQTKTVSTRRPDTFQGNDEGDLYHHDSCCGSHDRLVSQPQQSVDALPILIL